MATTGTDRCGTGDTTAPSPTATLRHNPFDRPTMSHELGESDWGDWLPAAVADADPDTVAIWYLGCNGVVLKGSGGTTLLIDPYLGTGDPPRTIRMIPIPFDPSDIEAADAVLATHEHSDHVHGPTQAPILASTGADYYAPDASMAVVEREMWTSGASSPTSSSPSPRTTVSTSGSSPSTSSR
jgi:hypothetical protein